MHNKADLHLHTTASDGTFTPSELVETAVHIGLRAIAVTDHDTVSGVAEAAATGRRLGLEVLPGVEISTDYDGEEIHLLGYLANCADVRFNQRLCRLKEARAERAVKIVSRLRQHGLDIDIERVRELAGTGAIGRPHVARALVEADYVASVSEAFDHWLGAGRPGFVSRYKVATAEGVAWIKEAAGIPVLAHPALLSSTVSVEDLLNTGILGIEAYHSAHATDDVLYCLRLADRRNLLVTGGSDCHGPADNERLRLGQTTVSYDRVQALKSARDGGLAT